MNLDDDIYRPAGLGGDGWWDDAVSEVKKVGKKIQKSSTVRNLEKRAVKAGADVLNHVPEPGAEARRKRRAANPGAKNRLKKGHKIAKKGADDDLDLTRLDTLPGPPGSLRSKIPVQQVGKQRRRMLED